MMTFYTDQERDPESGLYNYHARLYDPVIGMFITADSIVKNPFDPQTLNRYSYCRNNPLIYVDPSGHDFGLTAVIVGAVIGAVSSGAQSGWDPGTMLTGAAVGAISGLVGFQAGTWAFTAVGGETAGLLAGGVVGGAAGGATGGGLYAGIYGGDIVEGALQGAMYGAIGGAVTAGLVHFGVPSPLAAAGGGFASGLAQGGISEAGEGALYSFGGSMLGGVLRTKFGVGMDGEVPRRGTSERTQMETQYSTYAVTAEVHSKNWFWIMIGLMLGGPEHTWHTQDRLHGLYEETGTVRYYKLIEKNVSYPTNGMENYLGNNFRLFSNNCTTRFGFLHPAQYLAHHEYIYQGPYWNGGR